MELEFWKVIDGHETYKVSNLGRVVNSRGMIMSTGTLRNGYPSLSLDGKTFNVHVLVAKAFVKNSNPVLFDQVNHIDKNKQNNRDDNLEWTDSIGNNRHAAQNRKSVTRRVCQCDTNGNVISIFESIKIASESTGVSSKHIPSVCTGKRQTAGGYKWKYIDDPKTDIPSGNRIEDFPNYIVTKNGKVYNTKTSREMIQTPTPDGYRKVTLSNNGVTKTFLVHRLVATVFHPNPSSKPEVNHIDPKNKACSDIKNLEWVTSSENMQHAKHIRYHTCAVYQCDRHGKLLATYPSVKNAADSTGVDNSSIVKCCKDKVAYAGGFKWKYLNPKEYVK